MRSAPSLESKTVVVLPYGTLVRVCSRNAVRDTIENIEGRWVKVFWQEEEGYMFDGYLEEFEEESPIGIFTSVTDLVNDWKYFAIKEEKEMYGIYRSDSSPYAKYELEKIAWKYVESEHLFYPAYSERVPLLVVTESSIPLKIGTTFEQVGRMLFLGDLPLGYFLGGYLYADGTLHRQDSMDVNTFSIKPYELRFQYRIQNEEGVWENRNELLLRMNYYACNLCGGWARIHFIGDIDGDEKNDIIISYTSTYKGWNYGLFSTKYAESGRKFKEFTIGYGSE